MKIQSPLEEVLGFRALPRPQDKVGDKTGFIDGEQSYASQGVFSFYSLGRGGLKLGGFICVKFLFCF